MSSSFKTVSLCVLAGMGLLLSGCSHGAGGHPKDTAYVARDAESLYNAAKVRLDQGNVRQAAALFDEVERQHPYSPWARRAQIMSAFAYYSGRQYTQAVQAAQRFLTIHPGNHEAPYAYYLIAMCYYEQISDVDRDQSMTEQALQAMEELVRRFPQSEYAADARLKEDLLRDHLAGKEMEIGRYYERAHLWLAAELRFRRVIKNYQTTSHVPEALYRLVETNLALGIPNEAKRYAAVLGANYPGSKWYQKAYKLLHKDGPRVGLNLASKTAP